MGGEKGGAGPLLASTPLAALAAAGSKVRAAHRSPLSPAITHTWRCAEWQGPPPAERVRLPSRTQLQPPHKLHPTVCAGLCAAQTNTVGPARGGTGDGRKAAQHVLLRSGGAGVGGFPRDPACPQPTTAWRTLRRTIPSETQAHRHPRRPHRVAYTPVPSPLYPLAPLPTHGSKHAVQGGLATPSPKPHPASSIPASLSALSPVFEYHRSPHAVRTRQGLALAGKELQIILRMEQQDYLVLDANSSLGWSAGERDWFETTDSFLECKNAVTALDSGFGKRLSSTEVEGTLKDWPTDEQASLGRADGSLSNPCRRPTTVSLVADASSPSSLQLPIPRMQVREFEMTMATRWWDADDDEDTALPRIPWQTAAGSAWPWMHGRVSPPAHLAHVCARSFPELLSKCRSESVLVLQAASRMPACRCRS